MVKTISAAQAKAHFSSLLAEVAYGGQQILIERRGKPVAALVSVDDLKQLEHCRRTSAQPQGALALVGAWRDIDDTTIPGRNCFNPLKALNDGSETLRKLIL